MEDSNNSQNAPDGLGHTCPTTTTVSSALPASSPSSEDEREWNSRFDPTTPNDGCFWMALNSDGSVAGSSTNTHGPSEQTMRIAEVLMGLFQRREQEDAQSSQAADDAARPKAKPKPKARFLNYQKKDRKN